MKEKIKRIEYKGKTYNPTYKYEELSEDEFKKIREEYYKKPTFDEVKKEFYNIAKGGVKNTHITNYYVRDLLDKTTIYSNRWCIEDVLSSKELLSYFWARTKMNDKVFLPNEGVRRKLDTAFRIGGRTIASRPSNFPIKTVDEILKTYNVNNNYYDFSCGWGSRLTSALKNKVNYFGTDPNYLLTERLNQLAKDYKETLHINSTVDIRTQGSETFIPEWENTIGIAFSSPPYYCLEDYKVGNQSYKEGVTYEQWEEQYLVPTIKNIYKYLISNGFFIINIKNFADYNLTDDTLRICNDNGFELIDILTLKQCKKYSNKLNEQKKGGFINIDENIYVFKKKGCGSNVKQEKIQTTIFDYL